MVSSIGNKEIFARNLSFYIERSGKNQREIADELGFSTSTFNNWVMGNKYPRIDKIEMLANYFGIQKSDLIELQTEDIKKEPAMYDGLTENQKKLIEFAQTVPEDKAALILKVIRSIVEADE